ncbi:MAG: cell envelope integrity EipB family protein [Hyphomicrobiales bacterium]
MVVSALWMAPVAGWAGDEALMAPHRAVYDLELGSAESRAGLSGATGRMVLEMTGSVCEGWAVDFRIVNDFVLSAGGTRLIDSRSSSWESADGTRMRYSQRQYADGRLESETLLSVTRDAVDAPGEGTISEPEEETFTLEPGTLFPVAHQNKVLTAARQGERRDESTVYDGSDGTKSYQAISFIGQRQDPEPLPAAVDGSGTEALDELPFWPVTISYYPLGEMPQGEETPSHQVIFDMYDNGVAGDVTLDYGDFALEGTLNDIELLDVTECD